MSFGAYVRQAFERGELVVQPRMGISDPAAMRAGLLATRHANATTVGTITLDSYTRIGDHAAAAKALKDGADLNGFPIVAHGPEVTRALLTGLDFPVQVRHGSACPQDIIVALAQSGLDATEGGPVSYCLPYGRTPLAESVRNWTESCQLLASMRRYGIEPHLETFGGCMMGQLCPPSLLVALSALEAVFFVRHGLRSVSLSYAQQTHPGQDAEAVAALRRLAAELLPGIDWHVVIYAYMGVFPRSPEGATTLLERSADLAARSGAARLIVKTVAEAHRIPTVEENVRALETAARRLRPVDTVGDTGIYAEARALVDAVLELDLDFAAAFRAGVLDVPYCLHPDNANRARSFIDRSGALRWASVGRMPLPSEKRSVTMTAAGLLDSLSYVERLYDERELPMRSTREHLQLESTKQTLLIQNAILAATREYLTAQGFNEMLPPIIGPVTDPGGRGAKQVDVDFYGHRYKLMTSAILYKQATLVAFDKIFYIAPNVRLEPLETCNTNRHLAEFHQIDVEIKGATREQAMAVAEGIVVNAIRKVLATRRAELEALDRNTAAFGEVLEWPFDRVSHADAVANLRGMGYEQSADAEIDWQNEELLSGKAGRPFFVTDYPKGSRGFYDRESRSEPGRLRNFDLIAPEGYGELCSGSEREYEFGRIVARIRESGENPSKYGWYLEMARDGIPASAGFGIGLERLTRYIAGLESVWQASAYPKIPGVVSA